MTVKARQRGFKTCTAVARAYLECGILLRPQTEVARLHRVVGVKVGECRHATPCSTMRRTSKSRSGDSLNPLRDRIGTCCRVRYCGLQHTCRQSETSEYYVMFGKRLVLVRSPRWSNLRELPLMSIPRSPAARRRMPCLRCAPLRTSIPTAVLPRSHEPWALMPAPIDIHAMPVSPLLAPSLPRMS